jgi:hypothetical protein
MEVPFPYDPVFDPVFPDVRQGWKRGTSIDRGGGSGV